MEKVEEIQEDGKVKYTLCKGIKEWGEEERRIGREEGRKEGREECRLLNLIELVGDGDISIEKGAQKAGMSVEEFKQCMEDVLQIV